MARRSSAWIAIVGLLIAPLVALAPAPADRAVAAVAADFNPGMIISDALFYDGGAMTEQQVQSFLNAQVPTCRAGYTCLKNYRQDTTSRPASAGRCDAYQGAAGEPAARIIAKVGLACGVSQKALLVLLQKEQGLVTDTWPSDRQYRSATGYACPDGADCDSAYYGFFHQVYMAAWQFKAYAANPSGWRHVAGRSVTIAYNPNAGCGGASVYLQNQATAGLYNYTPYQPNAAALANLYGTGDSCSSYGNRNFWRLYTDWFGPTNGGTNLVRTVDNASVYLISGAVKYPIATLSMLSALAPLGNVAFVSQSYLDRFPSQQTASRVIRSASGEISFIDAGSRRPFGSCAQVADWGGSCGPGGYMQLTDNQVAKFTSGATATPLVTAPDGSRFWITGGKKREILDESSRTAAGAPSGSSALSTEGVAAFPFDAPLTRDSVFVAQRGAASAYLLANSGKYAISAAILEQTGAANRLSGALQPESLALIPAKTPAFNGIVRGAGTTTTSVLVNDGRWEWTGASTNAFTVVSTNLLGSYPAAGTITPGDMIKTASNGTVYMVMTDKILPIGDWEGMLALAGGNTPVIRTLPERFIGALPQGPVALITGTLVRNQSNATVYLVNGVTSRIAFSTFNFTNEAGLTNFSFTTDERLAAYPLSTQLLRWGITCGNDRYVSAGGSVHLVSPELGPLYPLESVPLDSFTCGILKKGAPATKFIRTPDGSMYLLDGGKKRPILTWQRWTELSGGQNWLDVIGAFANDIPTGPTA